jgi:hypothetical protein
MEYHSVCPFVEIGSPHPIPGKRVWPPFPRTQVGGGRGDTLAFGGGMGGPNSDAGTETLALYVYYNHSAVATEGPCPKSTQSASPGFNHRLNIYLDTKATCLHLKKLTSKGTLRHVFICLGPPSPPELVWGGLTIL